MSNTNCLEGMSCPACGSNEPFRIEVSTMADFFDAGSSDPHGDMAWSDDSYCECLECHHAATVIAFTPGRADTPDPVFTKAVCDALDQPLLSSVDFTTPPGDDRYPPHTSL